MEMPPMMTCLKPASSQIRMLFTVARRLGRLEGKRKQEVLGQTPVLLGRRAAFCKGEEACGVVLGVIAVTEVTGVTGVMQGGEQQLLLEVLGHLVCQIMGQALYLTIPSGGAEFAWEDRTAGEGVTLAEEVQDEASRMETAIPERELRHLMVSRMEG